MSLAYGSTVTSEGLILYLDAANPKSYPGSGAVWYDMSIQKNHCTLVGGPSVTGGTMRFNADSGNTQYMTTTTSSFQFGFNNFTISSWVFPITSGSPALFGVSALTTSSRYALGFDGQTPGSNNFFAFARDDNANTVQFTSGTISGNIWYNVTMTIERAGNMTMYLNGLYKNSTAMTSMVSNISPQGTAGTAFIVNGTAPYLNGKIGITQVYNRALSSEEVAYNFNSFRGRYGI